jgi:hypothetical protein
MSKEKEKQRYRAITYKEITEEWHVRKEEEETLNWTNKQRERGGGEREREKLTKEEKKKKVDSLRLPVQQAICRHLHLWAAVSFSLRQQRNVRCSGAIDARGICDVLTEQAATWDLRPATRDKSVLKRQVLAYVGFEVFTAVTVKKAVFWDEAPSGFIINRHFRGTEKSVFSVPSNCSQSVSCRLPFLRSRYFFYPEDRGDTSKSKLKSKVKVTLV